MGKSIIKTSVVILIMGVLLFLGSTRLIQLQWANEEAYLQNVMPFLLPGSTSFTLEESFEAVSDEEEGAEEAAEGEAAEEEEVNEQIIRKVYRGETGYVIHTVTNGYVDEIELLVGVDDSGAVQGLCVYNQHETFGLGARSQTDVTFLMQYLGTTGEAETGSTVDALTGATVSSKAVTKGVNAAVAYVTGADISSGATSWGG